MANLRTQHFIQCGYVFGFMMNQQFNDLCSGILKEGRQRFGAMLGIVSHIHKGVYEVVAVSSGTKIPRVGDAYNSDAVYCKEVIQKKKTVAITEVEGVVGLRLHPLYDVVPCEFYIGSPILIAGDVWGTVNFTSLEKRNTQFSTDDISFIEVQASRIANTLAKAFHC